MKSYIPYRILVINCQFIESYQDEVLLQCFRLSLDWANRMGLKGKRVYDFYLEKSDPKNPLDYLSYLWCKVECTEDERKLWKEQRELNVKHAVYEFLKE